MLQDAPERFRVAKRIVCIVLVVVVVAACAFFTYQKAYANFSSESADQVIGVGRIQSSAALSSDQLTGATRFQAPEQLADEPTQAVSQLAQPLDRSVDDPASAIENISMIQQFGEPDAAGWYTALTSAYGPSSAGQYTALGTELTLTSMDIGVRIDHIDLLGRYVDLMYDGKILRCRIVDTGTMANDGRLFDLQPGVCTYFGAATPEFGWDLRYVKWRFDD